jgi:predicted GNAT family acetyltransferase
VNPPTVRIRHATELAGAAIGEVLAASGRIVAFAHAGLESQDPLRAEIHGFYGHPHAWGTGTATALMTETCSALAADFADVVLWTLREAARARRFYEKAGFTASGQERAEPLSDWTTGATVERIVVEYRKTLTRSRT